MVKKKTVDGWGLPTIKYELAEDGNTVVKVYCAVCKDYYFESDSGDSSSSHSSSSDD